VLSDDLTELLALCPPPDLMPREAVFLGHDVAGDYQRGWTAQLRDSVALVGPPGYGKTAGIIIPAVTHWAGPVVSTSTRGDVLAATGAHRRRYAGPSGGQVYVYDPFATEVGVTSMRWSPLADCGDASIAYRRAAAMTSAAGEGMSDGRHWRLGAARVLSGVWTDRELLQAPPRTA
jgi:type IV secretory pathway TraG/TraD family ATPase VirD4